MKSVSYSEPELLSHIPKNDLLLNNKLSVQTIFFQIKKQNQLCFTSG